MGTLNSNDVASMILRTHYKYEAKDGLGIMTVKGIKLPRTNFDVFGCIWATVKKRVKEEFGVMSAGSFVYNDGIVSCAFCLSFAECEDDKKIIAEHIRLFDETFEKQMLRFKDTVEKWLKDEEWGYIPYIDLIDYANSTGEPVDETVKNLKYLVEKFLDESGLRTEEDRKAKAKRNKKAKAST